MAFSLNFQSTFMFRVHLLQLCGLHSLHLSAQPLYGWYLQSSWGKQVIAVNASMISPSTTEGLIVVLWLFYFTEISFVLRGHAR